MTTSPITRAHPSLGEQLDDISRRLTAATTAWAAAGYPNSGPVFNAREAVYADLHEWNSRVAVSISGRTS